MNRALDCSEHSSIRSGTVLEKGHFVSQHQWACADCLFESQMAREDVGLVALLLEPFDNSLAFAGCKRSVVAVDARGLLVHVGIANQRERVGQSTASTQKLYAENQNQLIAARARESHRSNPFAVRSYHRQLPPRGVVRRIEEGLLV